MAIKQRNTADLDSAKSLREKLNSILPFNTRALLTQERRKCVSSISNGTRRCLHPIRVVELFNEKADYKNISTALSLTQQTIKAIVCGSSHRTKALDKLRNLRWSIDRMNTAELVVWNEWIKSIFDHESERVKSDCTASNAQPDAEADDEAKVEAVDEAKQEAPTTEIKPECTTSDEVEHDTAAFSALPKTHRRAAPITRSMTFAFGAAKQFVPTLSNPRHIQKFKPYQPANTKNKTVTEALMSLHAKPLSLESGSKTGFIYIYWYPGNFGHVKIGYSERLNPDERLKEWSKQCKHEVEGYKHFKVHHMRRVESLVHTELKDHRRTEVCPGCGKTHKEWFEVEAEFAAQVIEKYQLWATTQPYERLRDGWRLKTTAMDGLEDLCKPLQPKPLKSKALKSNSSRSRTRQRSR
jgi:hypothetical protein